MATFIVDGVEQPRGEGESVFPKLIFDRQIGIFKIEYADVPEEELGGWLLHRANIMADGDGVPFGLWFFPQGYQPPTPEPGADTPGDGTETDE
ncbi:hypothetical protein [Amycolatopsis sp. lyj-346]|uniref:hypothetical protein n=1 Tax=Amycolatopsis sp. lyj-346 TaxID=2789289 RepID=UPI00397E479B